MHINEGLLPLPQAAAYVAVASPGLLLSFQKVRQLLQGAENGQKALFGLCVALVFAVTMIPIPLPFTAVMVHMCATPLTALLFGAVPMILPIGLVLLLQALFFGHGGLTTIGANIITLGIVGPLVTVFLYKIFLTLRAPLFVRIGLSVFIGSMAIYVVDAAILAGAMHFEQTPLAWFTSLVGVLSLSQLPLSLLEAVLSWAFIRSLAKRRSQLLPENLLESA